MPSSTGAPAQSLALVAQDGRRLAATWWPGAQAEQRSVVILPGLGIPQTYYAAFAAFLADRGWGVLTFDYRGVARSRRQASDEHVTLDDWVNFDIPAAIDLVRKTCGAKFLAAVAHSIGGQLLGQSSAAAAIGGALLVGAQRGIPRLYRGKAWCAVWYAYTVFPLLIRFLGRLPAGKLTLSCPCPAGSILQWVRWGRSARFTDKAGRHLEPAYARLRIPMIGVTIGDDALAPPAAVEALLQLYRGAALRQITIEPAAHRGEPIGHFGFFRRQAPRTMWSDAENWLRELEAQSCSCQADTRSAATLPA